MECQMFATGIRNVEGEVVLGGTKWLIHIGTLGSRQEVKIILHYSYEEVMVDTGYGEQFIRNRES
jgi:hypothetical protein